VTLAHAMPASEEDAGWQRPTVVDRAPNLAGLVQPRRLRDPERCPLRHVRAWSVEGDGFVLFLPCWRCGAIHRGGPR